MKGVDVVIEQDALDRLAKLPLKIRNRVRAVIVRLESYPNVSGMKALTGEWKGFTRIRTGDYRVIFHLEDTKTGPVIVVRIADRRDAYAD